MRREALKAAQGAAERSCAHIGGVDAYIGRSIGTSGVTAELSHAPEVGKLLRSELRDLLAAVLVGVRLA